MAIDLKDLKALITTVAVAIVMLTMPQAMAADVDHWETTNVSSGSLVRFVNSKNCYKSEKNFVACIISLNTLLRNAGKTLSHSEINNLPMMREPVAVLESLNIRNFVENKMPATGRAEFWKKKAENQNLIIQSWKNVFNNPESIPIPFEALAAEAIKFQSQKKLKMKIAIAINAYLGHAVDPHSYIAATSQLDAAGIQDQTSPDTKSISSALLSDPFRPDRKIGYIKIKSFKTRSTCSEFIKVAYELKKQNAEALLIDLRDNTGGLLLQSVCMAEQYLNIGDVVITEVDPKTNMVMRSHYSEMDAPIYKLYNKRPVIILQNASSASSSEVFAGALSTYGRAIIVGERSYGKGTIQSPQNRLAAFFTGVTYMETTSRFHFASGASNQRVGIAPDILAYKSPKPTEDEIFSLREAELYLNAVEAASPLTGFPPEAIAALNNCVETKAKAATQYSINLTLDVGRDYQLSIARDVAGCIMTRR